MTVEITFADDAPIATAAARPAPFLKPQSITLSPLLMAVAVQKLGPFIDFLVANMVQQSLPSVLPAQVRTSLSGTLTLQGVQKAGA